MNKRQYKDFKSKIRSLIEATKMLSNKFKSINLNSVNYYNKLKIFRTNCMNKIEIIQWIAIKMSCRLQYKSILKIFFKMKLLKIVIKRLKLNRFKETHSLLQLKDVEHYFLLKQHYQLLRQKYLIRKTMRVRMRVKTVQKFNSKKQKNK